MFDTPGIHHHAQRNATIQHVAQGMRFQFRIGPFKKPLTGPEFHDLRCLHNKANILNLIISSSYHTTVLLQRCRVRAWAIGITKLLTAKLGQGATACPMDPA
eukprot:scaffold424_cov162-Amphora_coffeaeformis.AAC.2